MDIDLASRQWQTLLEVEKTLHERQENLLIHRHSVQENVHRTQLQKFYQLPPITINTDIFAASDGYSSTRALKEV